MRRVRRERERGEKGVVRGGERRGERGKRGEMREGRELLVWKGRGSGKVRRG